MGIKIFKPSAQDIANIKKHLGPNANQFSKAFGVVNERTQARFDRWLKQAKNKYLCPFWHGSRNENWWSIIETGLVLRPTNAVISGKMFGYGLYFADKAQKSIGYTSLHGSYWASGSSNKAFLSLYEVHLGNFLKIKHHESWCGSLTKTTLCKRGDYDSLFAEGGADLRNNEYIVYDEAQCTIKFLVEIR
jgi:poly [ADP-ribose] polymerase